MIFIAVCILAAAGIIGIHLAMPKHKWLYCALYGHDDAKLGKVEVAKDLRWFCPHCKREVGPL